MADENELEVEVAATEESVVETPAVEEKKPVVGEKFDYVELTPDQQRRFNRLYAQVKTNEAVNKQLIEDNKKLLTKVMQIESQNIDRELSEAMNKLRAEKQRAYENGDVKAIDKVDDEIYELKEKQRKYKEETEAVNKDLETVKLDPHTVERVKEWGAETNSDGELLRPFVNPNHKDHKRFLRITEFVLTDPEMEGKSEDDMFEAVDKALKVYGLIKEDGKPQSKKLTTPSVLVSDGGSGGRSANTVSLTSEQRYVARKMFPKSANPERDYALALKELGKK